MTPKGRVSREQIILVTIATIKGQKGTALLYCTDARVGGHLNGFLTLANQGNKLVLPPTLALKMLTQGISVVQLRMLPCFIQIWQFV